MKEKKIKTRNTMGKQKYIFIHIIWALTAMIWYRRILFRCIEGVSYAASKYVLWGMLAVLLFAGIITSYHAGRNAAGVVTNIIIPYGLYSIAAYMPIHRRFILTVVSVSILSAVYFSLLILLRKIKNSEQRRRVIMLRIKRSFIVSKKIMAAGMAVIMIQSGFGMIFGLSLMKASSVPAINGGSDEYSISSNMNMVIKLSKAIWKDLSIKERLNVLQIIANIEREYLGLPNELNIGTANLSEEILGYYCDNTHEIIINIDSLLNDTSWNILTTVCHEAYHSYQHRIVDAYNSLNESSRTLMMFQNVRSYADEFKDYAKADKDYFQYYEQTCEQDAREYALDETERYCDEIYAYLEQSMKE